MFSLLSVRGLSKAFVLHTQGGVVLPVLSDIELTVNSGECVVLNGPSGAGKSTLLRCIFGNYRVDRGEILIDDGVERIDVAAGNPRQIIELRRRTVGYVSQFLRVVPRVSTLDVVSEPLSIARTLRALSSACESTTGRSSSSSDPASAAAASVERPSTTPNVESIASPVSTITGLGNADAVSGAPCTGRRLRWRGLHGRRLCVPSGCARALHWPATKGARSCHPSC